jgi:hypothetical protein
MTEFASEDQRVDECCDCSRRAAQSWGTHDTMTESSNFGAPIGQSQQLMYIVDLTCGAASAKLLSGGPRQSN